MNAKSISVVQTTVASRRDAQRLAGLIIRAHLAACVQMMPIRSAYRWKNRVKQDREWLLTAKTRSTLAKTLMAFIRRHHPYDVPEIVAAPLTSVLPAYSKWVLMETKAKLQEL